MVPCIDPPPLTPASPPVPVPGTKLTWPVNGGVDEVATKVPVNATPTLPDLPSIVPVNVPPPAKEPWPVRLIKITSMATRVPEMSPIIVKTVFWVMTVNPLKVLKLVTVELVRKLPVGPALFLREPVAE